MAKRVHLSGMVFHMSSGKGNAGGERRQAGPATPHGAGGATSNPPRRTTPGQGASFLARYAMTDSSHPLVSPIAGAHVSFATDPLPSIRAQYSVFAEKASVRTVARALQPPWLWAEGRRPGHFFSFLCFSPVRIGVLRVVSRWSRVLLLCPAVTPSLLE